MTSLASLLLYSTVATLYAQRLRLLYDGVMYCMME
jgi:hypothetical protein